MCVCEGGGVRTGGGQGTKALVTLRGIQMTHIVVSFQIIMHSGLRARGRELILHYRIVLLD